VTGAETGVIGWFTEERASDPAYAGAKGAKLAVLHRRGLPVPDGFVVATAAYRRLVEERALLPLIVELTARIDDVSAARGATATRLRTAIEGVPSPAWLRDALAAAYAALGGGPVAVRSSATAEDLPGASFAGQLDSVLDVVGITDLDHAVRHCMSSLWSDRAIAYRRQRGIDQDDLGVAVVVQSMVAADVAGVLFTADPVSGRRDRMVIEAGPGLGDAVVTGRINPDRWLVDAQTMTVLARQPAASRADAADLLDGDDLAGLALLGRRAAALFGCPQDVEWAIAGGRRWLLQSRPITSLFPLPPPSREHGPRVFIPLTLVGQGVAEPLTPAGTAFFRTMAAGWMRRWVAGARRRPGSGPVPWLPVLAGRLFCDITPVLQRRRWASKMISSMRTKDPTAADALRDWLAGNAGRLHPASRSAVPLGVLVEIAGILPGMLAAFLAPRWARRRALAATERRLTLMARQAAGLSTPLRQVLYVYQAMPGRVVDLIRGQVPAVYAELLSRTATQRLVARWLGDDSGLEPLLRWLPHDPTLAMGAELARIARHHANAGTHPATTDADVTRFLTTYGHRAPDREIDLGLPRLSDDPTYVVELIEGYLHNEAGGDALNRFHHGAAQSNDAGRALVTAVRRTNRPASALALRILLHQLRELGGLRERPKFDMVRALALARRTLHTAGVSLAARDLLDDPDDIYFLDPADVGAALTGAHRDLRGRAAANRREYERELRRRAVPRIVVSDGETIYAPAPRRSGPHGLAGTPVSPGSHEGIVRVLDSPVGADLRQGEVLVAASTDPGWTPLFFMAGALVMEVGGVISHGAVVAREYGIPAVAGIPDATMHLRTGQLVRVDGDGGTVTLLDAAGRGSG
jgi:pyruvate,water dikinase